MKRKLTKAALPIAALAVLALAAVPASAQLTVLLPYGGQNLPDGTPGFKYLIQPLGTQMPGFEAPAFPDSGWADGVTPFGGSGGLDDTCPNLWSQVRTAWSPNNSDLFVRWHLNLCPGVRSVKVGASIDNDLILYVNGFPVQPVGVCVDNQPPFDELCETEDCAVYDKMTFEVPDSQLVPGDNVFAVHARDRHVVAYLDLQVSADISGANCEPPANEPPVCEGAYADPGSLWPPNHKWKSIGISGVTDPDGDPVAVNITSIFQDEPVDARGNGDGNTCPDGDGVGTGTAWVRAERAGGADGRVYHIGFEATDSEGNTCQGTAAVCVPHDQGNGSNCIDQGALFDSTVCP